MPLTNKRTQKSKILRAAVPIVLIALLVAGGALAYKKIHHTTVKPTPVSVAPKEGEINYSPPTKQEKQAGTDAKQKIVQRDAEIKASETQSGLKQVTPVISYAGFDSVRSYVPQVYENGGVCTATFSQGSTVITRTSAGFENVSYTQCSPITPNLPNSNAWSVVVSYKSAAAQGSSAAVDIK